MASYQSFTSGRATEPDPASLLAALRALDATAGVQHPLGATYIVKKATAWSGPQITAAQNAIDTAPAATPQLLGQSTIDGWPIALLAFASLVKDQFNVLRAGPALPLPPFTDQQVLAAIRAKAATL
jgi:hypothetical protein